MTTRLSGLVMACCLCCASAAVAQQRPLVTEDPETIGSGRLLIESGFDYGWDVTYPGSGLIGNRLRFPTLGASIGISSIGELQVDTSLFERLSITDRQPGPLADELDVTGESTSDFGDVVIGLKLRLLGESPTGPGLGVRVATKLPTSSTESGLGVDTTDFFASFLIAKTVQSTRIVGNAGVGILGDATQGNRQSDVFTYGLSIAQAVAEGAEIVGEFNGRAQFAEDFPPPGAESRATLRVGARFTQGAGRFDAAVLFGTTEEDPGFGFTVGYTYVFNAFAVP